MTDPVITPSIGSVISGTLKVHDLLEAALDEASFLGVTVWALSAEEEDALEAARDGTATADQEEALGYVLDDVVDLLNDACSLPNVYYGAHHGDGADIGWWEYSGP